MNEVVVALLQDALLLLVTLLAGFMVAWLKKRLSVEGMKKIETELALKQELAYLAVRFVEQAFKDLKGEEKYTQAAKWLSERAGEIGLNIAAAEIKGLIEAALRAFKDEFGEEWAKKEKAG